MTQDTNKTNPVRSQEKEKNTYSIVEEGVLKWTLIEEPPLSAPVINTLSSFWFVLFSCCPEGTGIIRGFCCVVVGSDLYMTGWLKLRTFYYEQQINQTWSRQVGSRVCGNLGDVILHYQVGGSRSGFWQNEKQHKFNKSLFWFQIMLKFCVMFSLGIGS